MPKLRSKARKGAWFVSLLVCLCFLIILGGCSGYDSTGEDSITTQELSTHIQVLSSDEYEGRAPTGVGAEKTTAYLQQAFADLGLQPGLGDSYLQEVPLVTITADPSARMVISNGGQNSVYGYGSEYVAWTKRVVGSASVRESELVFVGYGIHAPEYQWNDYAGLDLRGKTVVILVNDPGYATRDSSLFNGLSMTYYGRWTYKFEEAARQGAAGAIIIHDEGPAGYPWQVVESSWSGPQFDLISQDNNMSRCAIEGWVPLEIGRQLFQKAALNLDDLMLQANTRDFKAIPMGLKISLTLRNDIKQSQSNNVIAVLPGSQKPEEAVFYMAHWDHLGKDPTLEGDPIYNGAFDNASGVAGLLELAQAFTLIERPGRSIVFLAVTAEEQGLLGSKHYAENPVFPHRQTVAAINLDGMNVLGPMNDITVVGFGNSELDDYVIAAAKRQNRSVRPDPSPEKGYYYRSDHFSFAKQGIPAIYTDQGLDHRVHGSEWTQAQLDEYTRERYHKPGDEFDPDWDLSGAVDDLRLLFKVGFDLSVSSAFPNWREGNEFKSKRDEQRN